MQGILNRGRNKDAKVLQYLYCTCTDRNGMVGLYGEGMNHVLQYSNFAEGDDNNQQ